jgi:hypothetical protein
MSDKQNLSKSQRKKQKREKRKASGSPEFENGVHYTPEHGSGALGVTNSQDYVQSVMMNSNTPVMNFNSQYPLGMQTSPLGPAVFPATPQPVPMWANTMMEDLKTIKTVLPKIDQIDQSVKTISVKITEMETKLIALESKTLNMETSVKFVSDEFELQKVDIKRYKEELRRAQKQCVDMERKLRDYEEREEVHNDKLLELESRSMRDNLIFYGLQEPETPKLGETPEVDDCEKLVRQLLKDKLNIDRTNIEFNRIHRLGSNRAKNHGQLLLIFSGRQTKRKSE